MWADSFFLFPPRGLDRRVRLGPAPGRDRRRRPTVPIEGRSRAGLAAASATGGPSLRRRVPRVPPAAEAA
jgi:hypothetical protein